MILKTSSSNLYHMSAYNTFIQTMTLSTTLKFIKMQLLFDNELESPSSDDDNRGNSGTTGPRIPTHDVLTEDALRALVVSLTAQPHQPPYPPGNPLV